MNGIIVAFISGGLALIGVIITSIVSTKNTARTVENKIITAQAVTDTKIDELTREVRLHNNFAQRVPVIEQQLKETNHRIKNLESYHR